MKYFLTGFILSAFIFTTVVAKAEAVEPVNCGQAVKAQKTAAKTEKKTKTKATKEKPKTEKKTKEKKVKTPKPKKEPKPKKTTTKKTKKPKTTKQTNTAKPKVEVEDINQGLFKDGEVTVNTTGDDSDVFSEIINSPYTTAGATGLSGLGLFGLIKKILE